MIIYCIENNLNGKKYIGKKELSPEAFLKSKYYGGGQYIKLAVAKHGNECFDRYVIERCMFKEELYSREQHWIKVFNTKWPNGYNLSDGGEQGYEGYWNGRKQKPETVENRAKQMRGEKHPYFGKHRDEETKKKISEKLKGKCFHESWSKGLHNDNPLMARRSARHQVSMLAKRNVVDLGGNKKRKFGVGASRKAFRRICFVSTEEELNKLRAEYKEKGFETQRYRVERGDPGFWLYIYP